MYGYAVLRYRLFDFREFVGRFTGWSLAVIVMVSGYTVIVAVGKRLEAPPTQVYFSASVASFLIWLMLAQRLPDWAQRLISAEIDYGRKMQEFADEVEPIHDEDLLISRLKVLCDSTFDASSADFVEGGGFTESLGSLVAYTGPSIIEKEVIFRGQRTWPPAVAGFGLLLPIFRRHALLGAIAVGDRKDSKMYTVAALEALRHVANSFAVGLSNLRSALEIEKRHQLDRYLAPQVVESVLTGHTELIQRRRRSTITVFFSDLEHFSELAEQLDPEALSSVLNEYLSEMADIAFANGGTLDKFIGDAIMVLFGAPIESEPRLQVHQCLRMAFAMQRRTVELSKKWNAKGTLKRNFMSRMGVHIGEATIGSFGSRNRVEFTAIGSTVNLASRLEGQCTPGSILVSQDTWRYLNNDFAAERRPEIWVKGFSAPVEAFEIRCQAEPV